MSATYRKRPVKVEVVQFTGTNHDEVREFMGCHRHEDALDMAACPYHHDKAGPRAIFIRTLEGVHRADQGDLIIRGVAGEFYPCKPDIFEATYELVSHGDDGIPGIGDVFHDLGVREAQKGRTVTVTSVSDTAEPGDNVRFECSACGGWKREVATVRRGRQVLFMCADCGTEEQTP